MHHNLNFSLDVALHVLILFTFLTIFFFAYVSKLEKQSLDDTITNSVSDNTNTLLNDIKQISQKYNIKINWNTINDIADKLVKNSQGEVPEIKDNNEQLYKGSMIVIIVGYLLFIGIIIFLKYYMGYDIQIGRILVMNIIIFSITGLIEYFFFMNVASKYVPVMPNEITDTMLERIKHNFQ
jgi:hypothetical protein